MARESLRPAVVVPALAHGVVTTQARAGSAPLLALNDISRRFGNVVALDRASVALRAGTIHALLGENGAGKTTLMRVAFGLVTHDSGDIAVDGHRVSIRSPADALRHRIGMVHQHFSLVDAMTVAENVALGGQGRFTSERAAEHVRSVASRTGLHIDPDAVVGTLSVAAQQRCEIIKALSRDVRVLILDEPTAVLAPAEARELLQWLRRFVDESVATDSPRAVVLITHNLRDALSVADEVTVLRHGRVVLNTNRDVTDEHALATAMLGGDPASASEPSIRQGTDESSIVVARADSIAVCDDHGVLRVRDASLAIHSGEIVGIAAVDGAGQHELLQAVAGRRAVERGQLETPSVVGFVPEDRHRDALMLDATPVENVALRDAGERRGVLPWATLRTQTATIIEQFEIRGVRNELAVRALSGGNQQKLVLGRELAASPRLLVVENPTRGLDIRATQAVHSALRRARSSGTAVLFYSSDLDETLSLVDRLLVLHDGRVAPVELEREKAGRAMIGAR